MIVIGTPTRGEVLASFTADLIQLMRSSECMTEWVPAIGTYLPISRTSLVEVAKGLNASHLLFIDSDMRFPTDTLDILLKANKDIIACNCPQRSRRKPTAKKDGKWLSSLGKSGLEKVDSVGTGIMLINMSVFDKVPKPWFDMPYENNKFVGEDVSFCKKARESGIDIWIDHTLSLTILHTGEVEFTHLHEETIV